jgi:peptidoglycan/xylan/chitin deacetylase (PgdA/CDA1 family)
MKPKVKRWLVRSAFFCIASGVVCLCCLPRFLPHLLSWSHPDICFRGNADRKRLFLTIDDSPSASTPEILAVLKKHNVPATFFIIGSHVHSDAQLKSVVDAGHQLGNHTYTHERFSSLERFSADFDRTDQLLRRFSTPMYFRPPYGASTTEQTAYVSSKGYRPVLGTVFPLDYIIQRPSISALLIRWLAVPGGIVIMHDGDVSGHTTAQVLDDVLPSLKRAGYTFDALEPRTPNKPDGADRRQPLTFREQSRRSGGPDRWNTDGTSKF